MTSVGPDIPKAQAVDKSGFPFQLAVERELRRVGQPLSWEVVGTEVPLGDDFADIVIRRGNAIAVLECKRVEGGAWHFLVQRDASSNTVRCRLEWHNPRARKGPPIRGRTLSKVFCDDFTMCEGSYESSIAVLPKKSAASSLETIAGTLLAATNDLGDLYGVKFGTLPVYLVPVVVTNAELSVCRYDPDSLDINAGILGASAFVPTDFVRFRKTLVTRLSNDYEFGSAPLEEWSRERERTVFVVSPSGLHRFLSGFRALHYRDGTDVPPAFRSPPEYGDGDNDDG